GIGNHGKVMKPYLVDRIQTSDYQTLDTTPTKLLGQAVSSQTADQVTELMVDTVKFGTAAPAAIPGVDVAGKTGTAQTGTNAPPYAWFVSFAPASDAQVAVAVMIQHIPGVSSSEIAGGRLGGPIAKAVMEAVMNK
ncbi:MAG TPA: penicillin-binding transpeptidase domain-containing protein, partial [Nocardioides sp.]|nr:penicillin-binding transpeptidase domain-containing protein [Nocardioides sp.]